MKEKAVSFPWKVYLFGFIMNSSGFVFGYCIAQLNNFFPFFMQAQYPDIKASEYDNIKSIFNTVFNGGGFVCTLTTTPLVNHFGRRTLFLSTGVLMLVLNFIQPYLGLYFLYLVRFCIGYIVCFYSILCPLAVNEAIPSKYTGIINSSFYFFITLGIQLAFLLKSEWTQTYYKWVLWFPILIEVIRLLLFFFFVNTETPRFIYLDLKKKLTANERPKQAADVENENQEELLDDNKSQESLNSKFTTDKRTQQYLKVFYKQDRHSETLTELNEEYKLQTQEAKKPKSPVKTALSKVYLKQSFIGLLLNLINQLCGINVIIFYSSNLFKKLEFKDPAGLTIIVNMFNVLGGFLNLFTTHRIGRKKLLSTGLFMITISYILNMMGDVFEIKSLIPVAICMFMLSFAMSIGGILYVYQVEILPGEVIPLISNFQWVFTLLISYFTLDLIQGIGIYALYCIFFSCSFATWFIFEGMACESKGKTLSQCTSNFVKKRFWQDLKE